MSIGSSDLVQIAIGLAIAVFVIGRQFVARPLNTGLLLALPLGLLLFGAQSLSRQTALSGAGAALLVVNGALAVALGAWRLRRRCVVRRPFRPPPSAGAVRLLPSRATGEVPWRFETSRRSRRTWAGASS